VDQDGFVLDAVVQSRRNTKAAKRESFGKDKGDHLARGIPHLMADHTGISSANFQRLKTPDKRRRHLPRAAAAHKQSRCIIRWQSATSVTFR
jgi:hypothetical protein